EHAPEEPTSPRLDVKGTPADIETFDGTLDFNAVAHSAAKADGIEVQEEVELKPQDLVVEGLAHTQYETGLFGTPPNTTEQDDGPVVPATGSPGGGAPRVRGAPREATDGHAPAGTGRSPGAWWDQGSGARHR